jgi:GNAT superfamily N-acetyltransferase
MIKITLLKNYLDQRFKDLFTKYFLELNITLDSDTKIFDFMQKSVKSENLKTYVYIEQNEFLGFIMFQEEVFTSSSEFFQEKTLFIREYFVVSEKRKLGIGQLLLNQCENYAKKLKIHKLILTTHTAKDYYINRGYFIDSSYSAKNDHEVLVKYLK